MFSILQGTTPTLTISVDKTDLLLSEIIGLELVFQQIGDPIKKRMSDVIIETEENTVSYHFTEEETLALTPTRTLNWQIRFKLPDQNIVGTPIAQINVTDLISNEVLT